MATTITFNTPTILRNLANAEQSTDATSVSVVDDAVANALISNSNLSLTATNNITLTANTGNITLTGSNVSLGNVANLKIAGGSNNQILTTDGAGNLRWANSASGGNGTPGGNNTQVQFNSNGAFGGSANFRFDGNNVTLGDGSNTTRSLNLATGSNPFFVQSAANANSYVAIDPTSVAIKNLALVESRANLGNVGNIIIGGGTGGQVLTTDGAGNLTWTTTLQSNTVGATIAVTGSDTQSTILNGTRFWLGNVVVPNFSYNTTGLQMQNSTLGYWTYVGGGTAVFNITFTSVFNGTNPDLIRVSLKRDNADLNFVEFVTTNPTSGPGGGIVNLSGTVVMTTNQTVSVIWQNGGTTVGLTDTLLTITRII